MYLAPECLNNELEARRLHSFNALLNHMVAILIFHAFQNIAIKFLDDQLLLVKGDGFKSLLDHPAAIHLECQGLYMRPQLTDQLGLLLSGAKLEEFLDHIVAKHVGHELVGSNENLLEDELLLPRGSPLQLLLDEPGPVLVLGELEDVAREVAEAEDRNLVTAETLEQRGPELVRGAGGDGEQRLKS